MALVRNISKVNLLFLSITSIIGSAWLFGSFYTAQIAGPAGIFSWFLAAFLIAFIGLILAELSTMLPLSGSSVTYANISHGKFCGGLFSWITWLWVMAIVPIEVQAVMQYSAYYIANIVLPTTGHLTAKGFAIATVVMFLLCVFNLVGVKLLAETNKYISLWKIAIPILIAFVFLTYNPHYENLTSHGFAPFGIQGVFSAISAGGVAFSFFGFQTGIFLAGEAENPQKSIPFSLFGSLLLSMLIYVLLQFSFIVALEPSSLANGFNNLHLEGSAGPFAGLLLGLGLVTMAKILYLDALVSPLGTAFGYVATSSRILYSLGLQDDAPKIVTKLSSKSIPWVSVCINFFVGMGFFLLFAGWEEMASFLSAAIVVSITCACVSLPLFRNSLPHLKRPFVLPYGTVLSFLGLYICTLMLYWAGFNVMFKFEVFFGIIVCGFIVTYLLNPKLRKQNYNFTASVWLFVYLVLCGVLSYFGSYGGGKNIISTWESFVYILLICFVSNFIAQKTALPKENMVANVNTLMVSHGQS